MNVLSFEYDTSYYPAAPFADIEVNGYDDSLGTRSMWAMIDSGADASVIPIRILNVIGADYKETSWMRGTAGGRVEVDLYLVAIRIGSNLINGLHVIGSPNQNEAIIGRDVLNRLVVTLNGHAETTEIVVE